MKPIGHGQSNNIIAGLDIGSDSTTFVIGEKNSNKEKMKLLGIATSPSAGIKKGIIIDRDQLIDRLEYSISEAELMANHKVAKVIISITGDHVRSLNTQAAIAMNRRNGNASNILNRTINLKDIDQVLDLAQAISLPVDRDILHTIPQEYLVDTIDQIKNPMGMTGRRLEGRVHLVTAATTAMNNLVNCVEELGINVEGLVFQPLASSLTVLTEDEKELGVTLVEIGASTTNVVVFCNGSIRHSAVIPIGASSITNDIAVMLQIGIKEAEELKTKYASAKSSLSSEKLEINISGNENNFNRTIQEKELSRYAEARMQEILQMVIREISRADITDPLTYGMVLTGGGANLRNLEFLIKENINTKVRVGIPKNIEGINDVAEDPRYATALGLLLWPYFGIDYIRGQKSINEGLKGFFKKIRNNIEELF